MGGIKNFLSQLLKDKIPRYHGILPCNVKYFLSNKVSDASCIANYKFATITLYMSFYHKMVLQYF